MSLVFGSLVQLRLTSSVPCPGKWSLPALGDSLSAPREREVRSRTGLDEAFSVCLFVQPYGQNRAGCGRPKLSWVLLGRGEGACLDHPPNDC